MNRFLLLLVAVGVLAAPAVALAGLDDHEAPPNEIWAAQKALDASVVYKARTLAENKIGEVITNYGFIGTNFANSEPSFEYPLGSGDYHMVRGGIWIGGVSTLDTSSAFVGVTTAAADGYKGGASAAASEFTPGSSDVFQRSTLRNSLAYVTHGAVSEMDYISQFNDQPAKPKAATGSYEDHHPLGLQVTQYNYTWSFADYAHIQFFHYVIKNVGPPLKDVYVGMYCELASGDLKAAGGNFTSDWFKKKQVGWVDSLDMMTERYCAYVPIPSGCKYFLVPQVVGVKLLGAYPYHPNAADTVTKKVTYACWSFSPASPFRIYDVDKYAILSSGTKTKVSPTIPDSIGVHSGDPVELLAVGPFPVIFTGDSVAVDFAYLGGQNKEDPVNADGNVPLLKRGAVAQHAYDLNYKVPVPPPSPQLATIPRDHGIDLYWDYAPEFTVDSTSTPPQDFEGFRVYAGEALDDLHMLAQYDLAAPPGLPGYMAPNDTTGFNTGMQGIALGDSMLIAGKWHFGSGRRDTVLVSGPQGPYWRAAAAMGDSTLIDGHWYKWAALPDSVQIDGFWYQYTYHIENLKDGFKHYVAVTAYDLGNPQIESLESSWSQNEALLVPGPMAGEKSTLGITVFPNPYRVETKWDAGQQVRQHYLWFANLPPQCTLRIYTLSGTLIYEKPFDGTTYDGSSAQGIYHPVVDPLVPITSGTMFGWDMITRQGQAAATGLYLWAVEDKHSGKRQVGKFLLVKSDREAFQ